MNKITYKIKEIGRTITGNTPSSSNPEHFGYNVMFVTPTDNFDNKYIKHTKRYLSLAGVEKLKSKLLPPKSLLITCIGSDMGKVSINKSECITNQQINSIILDDKFYPDYIYYCLKNEYLKLRNSVLGSTAIPILNKTNFENLELELLSDKNEQIKVSNILVNLDLKIELNNSINTELESMAKTIYDYWFVQFDFPDQNGKPYKSSGGEMVWNEELEKEIPKDWKIFSLGEICEIYQPKTISDKDFIENGKYLVHGSNGVIGRYDNFNEENSEIVVSCRGNCGNIHRTLPKMWVTGNAMVFKLKDKTVHNEFLYQLLGNCGIKKIATGSVQGQITRTNVSPLKVLLPSKNLIDKYSLIAENIVSKRILNLTENQELERLRDFLLPLLMNGQIKIND